MFVFTVGCGGYGVKRSFGDVRFCRRNSEMCKRIIYGGDLGRSFCELGFFVYWVFRSGVRGCWDRFWLYGVSSICSVFGFVSCF